MNKKRKFKLIYVILLFCVLVASVLLAFAVNQGANTTMALIRKEIFYVLVALLIIVPISILAMAIISLVGGKRIVVETVETDELPAAQSSQPVVTQPKVQEVNADGRPVGRFSTLCKLDENRKNFKRASYDKHVTLQNLCENFRNYAARHLKLYYSIDDIRRFIAGAAVSKIMILQGMSGTGKTSLAHAFGEFLDNQSTVISVQPMWKERTDLLGYYNEFTKRFNETQLLEKMYEANYSDDIYVTVMDEMNIARVEYYFAEFLSLLELPKEDEKYLSVVSDSWDTDPVQLVNGKIKLPPNMWFIGTANNDDSTFAISDKVYDRAMVMNLDQKCERFSAPRTAKMHVSAEQFVKLVAEAQQEYEISKRNLNRLAELDAKMIEKFHVTFGNRIMKQIMTYIPVYVSCGGDELEALDDILAKKVMRKLEMQNPVYVRNEASDFCNYLDDLFGVDKMKSCKEFIHRLERNS